MADGYPFQDVGARFASSGIASVAGTLSAVGTSSTFTPTAGRDFNVYIASTANTVQLERRIDGATWVAVLTPSMIAALPPSFTMSEPQVSVPYRFNVIAYVAPQDYRFSA